MDLWTEVRRFVLVEGRSKRAACRRFGISWGVLEKMLEHAEPPGYRLSTPRPRPKLGPFLGVIDQILKDDRTAPPKQRHTAKRIFDRLVAEHGYTGGYTQVKEAVRRWRGVNQEAFVPLTHAPGEAQVDFGEAKVRRNGRDTKVCLFVMSLPHSDALFMAAYPRECTEAFLDGHVRAFAFFGGVPRVIRYDNTRIAVTRILGARRRQVTEAFGRLTSHFLFEHQFCRVRRANEKGHVETLIGFGRRNFLVPVPETPSLASLNTHLAERCRSDRQRSVRGKPGTKDERLGEDRDAFLPPPAEAFEARRVQPARASSLSLVGFDRNSYSVPVAFAHHELTVVGTIDTVRILHHDEVIAAHERDWGRDRTHFDPVHYLALLERKPGAFDSARPLENWALPVCFGSLRRAMEATWGPEGTRRFIRVLRLLEEHPLGRLTGVVKWALEHGCFDEDAVKLIAQNRAERPVALFPLDGREQLQAVHVAAPDLSAYGQLGGAA